MLQVWGNKRSASFDGLIRFGFHYRPISNIKSNRADVNHGAAKKWIIKLKLESRSMAS